MCAAPRDAVPHIRCDGVAADKAIATGKATDPMRLALIAALCACPALAQAQPLTLTGEGRLGLLHEEINSGFGWNRAWAQDNRLILNFGVEAQSDLGLSLGAHTRVQIGTGMTGVFSGSHVFVQSGGMRLSFGNLDGAILTAGTAQDFGNGCGAGYLRRQYCGDAAGLVTLAGLALDPFVAGDGRLALGQAQAFDPAGGGHPGMVRLDGTFGAIQASVSHQRGGATEVGIRGRMDAWTLALGYANRAIQADPDPITFNYVAVQRPGRVITASVHHDGGTWSVGVIGARVAYDGPLAASSHTNWSVSVRTDLGGGSLSAYTGVVHGLDTFSLTRFRTAGVSYAHDLGGGATLSAGLERLTYPLFGSRVEWRSATVGVAFRF